MNCRCFRIGCLIILTCQCCFTVVKARKESGRKKYFHIHNMVPVVNIKSNQVQDIVVHYKKNNKYQDLKNDLRTTWGLKDIELIPVVIGATGLVKTNLQKHLKSIKGEPALEEVQLAAIKGTIRLLKRALSHQG